jgi:hypothetical protein
MIFRYAFIWHTSYGKIVDDKEEKNPTGTLALETRYIIKASFSLFLNVGAIQKDCTMLLYYHVLADRRHQVTLFIPFIP